MEYINLPSEDRGLLRHHLGPASLWPERQAAPFNRTVFAAAHVVADPLAAGDPWLDVAIDWDRTMALRHRLWDLGFAVAEAMDTAQRGMGLPWTHAQELIRRSLVEARSRRGTAIACGAGTDDLANSAAATLDEVVAAYLRQAEFIERHGGQIILMASRALVAAARSPDDYAEVYGRVLRGLSRPAILHWLGEMFDPALAGYWGSVDSDAATDTCLAVLHANAPRIDGIKISLLDKTREIDMRRRLPIGIRMYTGDDFNYPELIAGDEWGHSDALLGIFSGIAPQASAALSKLAAGSVDGFHATLDPTLPLARHLFQAPTRFYKTGLAFLSYLNGDQEHFCMLQGQQSARSLLHLSQLFQLADRAGTLRDPCEAARRMRPVLALHGVG